MVNIGMNKKERTLLVDKKSFLSKTTSKASRDQRIIRRTHGLVLITVDLMILLFFLPCQMICHVTRFIFPVGQISSIARNCAS